MLYCKSLWCKWFSLMHNIDGLVQDCSNSIANALEVLLSCTKPSIWCTTANPWGMECFCEFKVWCIFHLLSLQRWVYDSLSWGREVALMRPLGTTNVSGECVWVAEDNPGSASVWPWLLCNGWVWKYDYICIYRVCIIAGLSWWHIASLSMEMGLKSQNRYE